MSKANNSSENPFHNPIHNLPIQKTNSEPEEEGEAWDQFFNQMTRKVLRSDLERMNLFPEQSLKPQNSVPIKPQFNSTASTQKPSSKPLKLVPPVVQEPRSHAPITSRFKPQPVANLGSKPSLVNPPNTTPPPRPQTEKHSFSLSNIKPNFNSLLHPATPNLPNLKDLSPPEEPAEISEQISSHPIFSNLATATETRPKEPSSLISSPNTKISPSLLSPIKGAPKPQNVTKKIKSQKDLKSCSVCTQMKSINEVFICERCEEYSCLKHRKSLFWCETCFLKVNKFHPYYETITEKIKATEKEKNKFEPTGPTNFLDLSNIFHSLTFLTSSEGLLVIGNKERKRGICFLEDNLLFVSFGTPNHVNLGTLLLKNFYITEEGLERALRVHKEESIRLGEALLKLNLISEDDLSKMLNEQVFQEIVAIAHWPQSTFKFRPGKMPPNLLNQMKIDTVVKLENPKKFRQKLSFLFHHLSLIFESGILFLKSKYGSIGLLAHQSNLKLINFQPKDGFLFGEFLVKENKLTLAQLREALTQFNTLEEYLTQKEIMTEHERRQALLSYIGEELKRYFSDPNYRCQFLDGEATQEDLSQISMLDLGINLQQLQNELLGKIAHLPPVLSSEEIFSLVFDKKNPESVTNVLHEKLHQEIDFEESRLNEFEQYFLKLIFIKSYFVNYTICLDSQIDLLWQEKHSEAEILQESLEKI